MQASKEKEHLQKKIDYLNKSIESIKKYDYSTGKHTALSPESRTGPVDAMEILKKNKEFQEKVREERRQISLKKQAERKRH